LGELCYKLLTPISEIKRKNIEVDFMNFFPEIGAVVNKID
jgi:hypothetical protein